MQLRSADITALLKEEILDFDDKQSIKQIDTILSMGDGIARVWGLEHAQAGEVVEFSNGAKGIILNLEAETVDVVVFCSDRQIQAGDSVRRTGMIMEVPVGPGLLGRVVEALGRPIDGLGPLDDVVPMSVENTEKHGFRITERRSVFEPV